MEIYEAMSSLRAVRRLKPDPIPADVLDRVFQAAAWAPTGGNTQPFRIIAVSDRDKMIAFQKMYHEEWQSYTKGMRAGLDQMPEPQKTSTAKMLKAGDYLADHMADTPQLLVFCFNPKMMAITDSDLGRPSIVGGGSVYTAVQNLMLACRTEGLGCVLTTLLCLRETEVRELLEIPDTWFTCAHIPIGYPVLKGHGPIKRRPINKMVFTDTFGAEYG